ncbi:MAG: hypothetical protein MI922_30730 [Bacteroidales bacterium]|nr:hypothetical protein [Bacteroidales bacterium]
MKKQAWLIIIIALLINFNISARQNIISYEHQYNTESILKHINTDVNSVTNGELFVLKVPNNKITRNHIQNWIKYTHHQVVSVENNEHTLSILLIKVENSYYNQPIGFVIFADDEFAREQLELAQIAYYRGMDVKVYCDDSQRKLEKEHKGITIFKSDAKPVQFSSSLHKKLMNLNEMGVSVYFGDNLENSLQLNDIIQLDICKN